MTTSQSTRRLLAVAAVLRLALKVPVAVAGPQEIKKLYSGPYLRSFQHDSCKRDAHCLNGGLCKETGDAFGSRECQCLKGFDGARCEHYCPLDCHNGGVCHYKINNHHQLPAFASKMDTNIEDFACKCRGYFTGNLCEIPYENCSDRKQCLYGGTCRDTHTPEHGRVSHCICPPGKREAHVLASWLSRK